MFLKCYSGLRSSPVTHKQHSDYAVSSDKLRVMTRDGSGSEGEYLAYLAPTGSDWLWAWEQLRPQRGSAFFPVDCLFGLFGGENQSDCCCRPVEGSNHSLFLEDQISFIS